MKKASWIILAVLSILIGLYPISYFVQERTFGLLQFKSLELLQEPIWNIAFYGHIIPGGITLLIGWVQFSKKWRQRNIELHRKIGKLYVILVMISGICSLYIALFATGGLVSKVGFFSLGLVWLMTTWLAFSSVKQGDIIKHQEFMLYSYAACFAAVTLRLWMPILMPICGDFIPAYRIVAWLCWIPNLLVAYFIIKKQKITARTA